MNVVEEIKELPRLMPRAAESNKGSFGRVLVVAGSRGMSGAAILCGMAALRGGAGLVRVATPAEITPVAASANPCYMTLPLPQDNDGILSLQALDSLLSLVKANDVTAIGPGIGRSDELTDLVSSLLLQADRPVVLDADGLNALAGDPGQLRHRQGVSVLTPHPGEFARLVGKSIAEVQAGRRDHATRFAADFGVTLVLKGHCTLVTDGRRVYENTTGNPGLATGGTGDVLTGLIAALIGQKLEPFAAAQLGVYCHGLAGDLARDRFGEVSLIASDLLDFLPAAIRSISG